MKNGIQFRNWAGVSESLLEYLILCVLAFTAGATASFAMAPYHWWGLLFPAFSGLYLLLLKTQTFKGGAGFGWAFGFGYFLFSLSWIGNALLVEGNPYAWAWPLAVCALPAALAFFPAITSGISSKFFDLKKLSGFLCFCALFSLSEWLRGHLFTGFPWNLSAYAWGENLILLQSLSIIDVYTLSLFTFILTAVPGFCLIRPRCLTPWALAFLVCICAALLALYGNWRLTNAPMTMRDDINIKIIQPNIAQHEKWDSHKIAGHFQKLIDMSYATGSEIPEQTTLVVWPETALHNIFLNDRGARGLIQEMLGSYGGPAFLVTGALIRDPDNTYGNTVITIDKSGEIINRYNKFHLVPFGEYIPFQQWIPIETITQFSGFKPGNGPETKTLDIPGSKAFMFSPLVCYEILFPGAVIDPENPPDAIINVTNDGWYGYSAGPYQHVLKARFRAIEEGIPVIRAANTGISTVIDSFGRNLSRSELFIDGVYNTNLPVSQNNTNTIKGLFYWLLTGIFYACGVYARKTANFEL